MREQNLDDYFLLLKATSTCLKKLDPSKKYADSFRDAKDKISKGDGTGLIDIAFILYDAVDIINDDLETLCAGPIALQWLMFAESIDQVRALAQTEIGRTLFLGRCVDKEYQQATLWYKAAIENGVVEALTDLGQLYLEVGKVDDGLKLLEKAATKGEGDAAWTLFEEYLEGSILPEDLDKAKYWKDKAEALAS